MPTPEKERQVAEISELLKRSQLTILTDYRGLSVSQLQTLRRSLGDHNAGFRVVKNTLTGLAADNAGLSQIREHLEGPTAIVVTEDDVVAPAKVIQEFARRSRILQVKVGLLEGAIIPASEVDRLASMPSREELLGKVVGGLNAPIYGFVNVLAGTIRQFSYVLQARAEQLGRE